MKQAIKIIASDATYKRAVALICLLFTVVVLTGCPATIQTVKMPVPVECREEVPERPVMPTEQYKAKPSLDEFTRDSQAEIKRREGYETKLRTALEACTAPIKP